MNLYNHLLELVNQNKIKYENVAIVHKIKSFSYGLLIQNINNYSKIFEDNNKVGIIYLAKTEKFIFSLLGLNKSNNIFCPVDISTPLSRLKFLVNQLKPKWVITDKPNDFFIKQGFILMQFEDIFIYINNIDSINYNKSITHIYSSSGSTGFPKIIYLNDSFIIPVIQEQIKIIQITNNSHFAWLLSPSFDASLSDIFVSLFSGAILHICNFKQTNIKTLNKYLFDYKITHTDISPSILNFLKFDNLNQLKHIVIGGELANQNNVLNIYKQFSINFYNAYGPTETTICSSMKKIDLNWINSDIGLPFPEVEYLILEQELLICGHLFLGYSDEALNNNRFIKIDDKIFYKTGDLVVFKNNSYHYIGRKDRQFKKNGNLICPEEIENFCKQYGCDVAILKNIDNSLLLEYTGNINLNNLQNKLIENFPSYMIPQKFLKNQQIITNINGKVIL